jgi:hypothetical protein
LIELSALQAQAISDKGSDLISSIDFPKARGNMAGKRQRLLSEVAGELVSSCKREDEVDGE